ncbi:hypothetical protein [Bacillus sp. AFS040349]|uniref:hypothetical protein n=1 Tax=Bacillus sp. AFS040349 TaxID=2033502 RepID=UPI000BFB89FB|nr:hypothetical protein [Bacillus sp. AFS040349]PGT80575.1 hypothetical protein COD11_20915 [Bacillus sp. AFS040349]
MSLRMKITIIVVVCLVIGGLFSLKYYQPMKESIDIKTEGKAMVEESEGFQPIEINTPLDVVRYTFSTVYYEKPLLFSQNFDAEQFFKDLVKVQDHADNEIIGEDAELYLIKKINRNGLLEDVEYAEPNLSFSGDLTVKVKLIYSDEKTVPLTIDLYNTKDNPTYYITSSVWDIIEEIESKVK